MGEMVHIRLDAKMRNEIKNIVKDNMFSNETEFIRDSLRSSIETYRKIQILNSMRNKFEIAKNPAKLKKSEVFRAFGLEE